MIQSSPVPSGLFWLFQQLQQGILGRPKNPTPIPDLPGFNPLGKKRPARPTPIPGVPNYPGITQMKRPTILGG